MRVGLAAAVARGLHAHQARGLTVLHVAHEDPVLDQHVAARGRALVVHGDGAAPVRDGAVVEHGDALGRDLLAHQPGEGGGLLAVEVALQPVTHRLVQENPGPAWAEGHVHHAGGRGDRVEVHQGDAQRLAHVTLPGGALHQGRQPVAPAAAVGAALAAAVLLDDHRDVEARHGPHVAHADALGAQDLHLLEAGGHRGADLDDARVQPAGEGVDFLEGLHLEAESRVGDGVGVAVEALVGAARRIGERAAALGHGEPRRADGARHGRLADLGGVRVARRLAAHGAQPEPLGGVVGGRAQAPVVVGEHLRAAALQKELPVVGAGRRLAQQGERARLVQLGLEGPEGSVLRRVGHGVLRGRA